MKAAHTLHCLPLLGDKSFLTQGTTLTFKNFLAIWSIMDINKHLGLLRKKKKKTCKMSKKTIWFTTYRWRQGLYNVCDCLDFGSGQSERAISVYIYTHTMCYVVIWSYPCNTTLYAASPSRGFSLEMGRRHPVSIWRVMREEQRSKVQT